MKLMRLEKLKQKWDWLYKNGKLNEIAVLKEISDYDFILKEVPKVYCEITGGLLSKPNYEARTILTEFNERFLNKEIIKDDIKYMIKNTTTLKELKEELTNYFNI